MGNLSPTLDLPQTAFSFASGWNWESSLGNGFCGTLSSAKLAGGNIRHCWSEADYKFMCPAEFVGTSIYPTEKNTAPQKMVLGRNPIFMVSPFWISFETFYLNFDLHCQSYCHVNVPTDVGIVFNLWGLKTSESTWTQRWSLYSANKKSRTIGPAIQKFHRGRICQRFDSKFSCCLSIRCLWSPWGWGKLYPRSSCWSFKQLEDFISEKCGVQKVGPTLEAQASPEKLLPN